MLTEVQRNSFVMKTSLSLFKREIQREFPKCVKELILILLLKREGLIGVKLYIIYVDRKTIVWS